MGSKLLGVRMGGFRSLGPPQDLDLTSGVTLLAGANNVGKSNVLRFLRDVGSRLPALLEHRTAPARWGPFDPPGFFSSDEPLIVGAQVSRGAILAAGERLDRNSRDTLEELLDALDGNAGTERFTLAVALKPAGDRWNFSWAPGTLEQAMTVAPEKLRRLAGSALSGTTSNHETQAAEVLKWLVRTVELEVPSVVVVPAFRQVQHGDANEPWSGHGIIDRLALLQHPPLTDYDQDLERFHHLSRLVQSVTEDPAARVELPTDKSTIHVHLDGRVVPLEALGTGIHEVVLIGAAATVERDALVCLEEPEAHLHPVLQRKLVDYLAADTSNRYVIATHSAHVLDTPQSRVVHVRLDGGQTKLGEVMTPGARWRICHELGYRASDLIQANYLIWVEGPSDRVYVNYWLSNRAPELREGRHYSIMFYGGRLLSHLTAGDAPDLIELLAINRNVAVLMDSDSASAKGAVGATKQRIIDELTESGGLAWVTAGREIENYCAPTTMKKAHEWLGRATSLRMRQFDRMYEDGINKMALAIAVTEVEPVFRLDLEERLASLVERIREANGMASMPTSAGHQLADAVTPA